MRKALLLAYLLLVGCKSGGPDSPGPDGGDPGAPDGGGGGLPDGASPPPPPPPLKVECTHEGSGRDIQVGNPNVETGANIVQVASIGGVDWNHLVAGDTVRIFWRAAPYHEKFLLSGKGTDTQPIRVCGVPGPNGERPVISGENATTRPDLADRYGALDNGMQDLAVVAVWNRDYDLRPEHIVIEGLAIRDTLGGDGKTGAELSYTSTAGTTRKYLLAAACLRVQKGRNIVIRNNEISNCGNGLFILSRVPESQMTRQVLIEGNHVHGNGTGSDEGIHGSYLQGVDFTLQGNRFGPNRPGAKGTNTKLRVAGDVVRYNFFDNGARVLDFVEVEDHAEWVIPRLFDEYKADFPVTAADEALVAAAWQAYQHTFCYGNVIFNHGAAAATNLVHYSFDNVQNDRRPGTLYFYDNTVLVAVDFTDISIVRLVDQGPWWGPGPILDNDPEDYATVQAWNNVIVRGSETPGQQAAYWEWTRFKADKLVLGKNWITAGWQDAVPGYGQVFPGYGNRDGDSYVYPGGDDTHHVTGAANLVTGTPSPIDPTTFRPVAGSPLLGQAAPLLPAVLPANDVLYELELPAGTLRTRARKTTIGAFETP